MNDFDDVETALARYRPAVPSADATIRIARGLATTPRLWRRRWIQAAAAAVIVSIPAVWWAFSQRAERQWVSIADVPEEFATYWKSQPRVSIPSVDVKADVVVVGFNDWLCPACQELYVALEAVFADYEKAHPGVVVRLLFDWPWEAKCNPYLRSPSGAAELKGHDGACTAAAAVRAARDRGQGDQLVEWLEANRNSLRGSDAADRIIQHARELLPGVDVDAAMAEKQSDIDHDIAIAHSLNVNATPMYFVNGVKLMTVKPEHIAWAIKLELARRQK